jgi:hypothetical protein
MRYSSSGQYSITHRRGVRWRGSSPLSFIKGGVLSILYNLFDGIGGNAILSERYTIASEEPGDDAILSDKYILFEEDKGDNAILAESYSIFDEDIGTSAMLCDFYTLDGAGDFGTTAILATEYKINMNTSDGTTTAVLATEYVRG